ncbi:MAG: BACON domain-containing protein [Bacteroidales bacterium]|nr:BACON domain-containing protein [Bacteroidales bacterium]
MAAALSSCSDQFVKGVYIASANEYMLNASLEKLQNIPAEGGIVNSRIEATSSVEWELQGLPDWCTTTTLKGTGSQDISFNVSENESFSSPRSHIFNLMSTNQDWSVSIPVSIIQQKKAKTLDVNPSDKASLTFDSKGGQKTLSISSNVPWTAECKEAFLAMSQTSAQGDLNLVISVGTYDQIDVTQNRTATVYFKDAAEGDVLQVITVTQTPLHSTITTERISVEFDQTRSTKVYSLGNISGGYSVSSDAPWLSITKNKGQGMVDVTLSVEPNGNDDERTSKAYVFLDANGVILYAFDVRQKSDQIELQPNPVSFTASGGASSVEVKTDSRWRATNNNGWLTVQEESHSCRLIASENNSLSQRTGIVEFNRINDSGETVGKTVTLAVEQEPRHITPDTQTLQFGPDAATKELHIDCDASWTLANNDAWISLSPTSGNGSASVQVSVGANASTQSRTGTLYLKCLDRTIEIAVIQGTPYVNIESNSVTFEAKGGTSTLSLSANVNWTASSSASWLGVSPGSGNGDNALTLTAARNDSPERNAVITISSVASPIKVNVKQKAPSLEVSKSSLSFSEAGGTSEPIIVTADYDYIITTSASWIKVTESSNTFTVTAEPNKVETRKGSVVISLVGVSGTIQRTISISQKGDDTPYVDLGLPSGTKWCAYNKGATRIGGNGNTYTGTQSDQCNCPSQAQANELISKCTWKYTTLDGVTGYQVTGPNGNNIFFPSTPTVIMGGYSQQGMYIWVKGNPNPSYYDEAQYYLRYSSADGARLDYVAHRDQSKFSIREVR